MHHQHVPRTGHGRPWRGGEEDQVVAQGREDGEVFRAVQAFAEKGGGGRRGGGGGRGGGGRAAGHRLLSRPGVPAWATNQGGRQGRQYRPAIAVRLPSRASGGGGAQRGSTDCAASRERARAKVPRAGARGLDRLHVEGRGLILCGLGVRVVCACATRVQPLGRERRR